MARLPLSDTEVEITKRDCTWYGIGCAGGWLGLQVTHQAVQSASDRTSDGEERQRQRAGEGEKEPGHERRTSDGEHALGH